MSSISCMPNEERYGKRLSVKRKQFSTYFNRIALPIDEVEQQIIELLTENNTSIIIGETGSGKSTQIPQLCIRAGLAESGCIGVSQPRRVACISLASRVSSEMQSELGERVGYHVRFERAVSDATQICYLTDGILLREAIHDPVLKDYSTIVVDEAHERSLHTDILLNVLRLCQRQRLRQGVNALRVIIMSATLQADLFSKYFDNAPVYVIRGRTFPVDTIMENIRNSRSLLVIELTYYVCILLVRLRLYREPVERVEKLRESAIEMLAMGLKKPRRLKLIEPPEEDGLVAAEEELFVSCVLLCFKYIKHTVLRNFRDVSLIDEDWIRPVLEGYKNNKKHTFI
uniref:RNA helicase n=1 Tax=Heterorhabditis bacteriophora TaxID=37862 RepID=A0A1I7XD33_HETBA